MAEITDDMLEGLENVTAATEELYKSLQKMTKGMGDTSKANTNQIKQLGKSSASFDDLNDSVRDSSDEQDRYTRSVAKADEIMQDMSAGVKRATVVLGDMYGSVMNNADSFDVYRSMIDPATDLMKNLGDVAGSAAGGLLKFGGEIPIVGGMFEGLGEATDKAITGLTSMAAGITNFVLKKGLEATETLWNMFDGAASAGVLVTGGMIEMQRQQKEMELQPQEYVEFLKNQSDALAQFGGSVGEGAKQMASVAKYSRQYEREMRALGVTWQEQAEMQAEFFQGLQKTGQLQQFDDQQKAAASADYIKTLKALSALTGKSVDELTAEKDERTRNIAAQRTLSQYTGDVRVQMQALNDTGLPGFKNAITEMMSTGGNILQDVAVIQLGLDKPLKEMYQNITSGQMTMAEATDDFNEKLRTDFPDLINEMNERFDVASLAQLYSSGDEVTSEIQESIYGIRDAYNIAVTGESGIVASTKEIGKSVNEGTENIIDAMKAARTLQGDILKLAQDNMPMLTGLMKTTTETMSAAFKTAQEIMDDPTGWAERMIKLVDPMEKLDAATGGAASGLVDFNNKLKELTDGKGISDMLLRANPITGPMMLAGDIKDKVSSWFGDDDEDEANLRNLSKKDLETKQIENQEQIDRLNRNIENLTGQKTEERSRINSSLGGEDEYWGSEATGQAISEQTIIMLTEEIAKLNAKQEEQLRKAEDIADAIREGN